MLAGVPGAVMSVAPTLASTPNANPPRLFLLDPQALSGVRLQVRAGHSRFESAMTQLVNEADRALKLAPPSVMAKTERPPSGDRHDFLSLSRYSWPNPNTPDGLPYVTRDGEVNPETLMVPDADNLGMMTSAVYTLAIAYYLKGDEKYAEQAAKLLRAWFLDAETQMNPNLNYAQLVRGKEGEAWTVIDAHNFSLIPDSVGLLAGSPAWTASDQQRLETWFKHYLNWLLVSSHGQAAARTKNNLGTWYDVQVASIALFVGDCDTALSQLQDRARVRIAEQIEPDGRQSLELGRTKSWDYSLFDLSAWFRLAALAQSAGVDLWQYRTADGRTLRGALDYLIPFGLGQQSWPYEQIQKGQTEALVQLLLQAAAVYGSDAYLQDAARIAGPDYTSLRETLLYPYPP
jgi:hypothetical protein